MKVYGGCLDGRNRVIVAAKSHAEAIRLWQEKINTSAYYARLHSCETGNEAEVSAAMRQPRVVLTRPIHKFNLPFHRLQ